MATPLYNNIPSIVGDLLTDVKNGRIGLPDLQRPFVWKDNKVRALLDSMYKGFPIGYIMLWDSPEEYTNRNQIGVNNKRYDMPDDLVIDGQQRLTALLAALYGVQIKDKNYNLRNIKIAFNPLTEEFQVWTQAYEKDPEYISVISDVFEAEQNHSASKFRRNYINLVNAAREKAGKDLLTDDEKDKIEDSLNNLLDINNYSLPTLKISSKADEEDVAEIFVRVNSGGQKLAEKNFIETLLAVFDKNVHDQINDFCERSRLPAQGTSYNQIIKVEPSHLIRMAVGVGFHRARLRYAYMLLRGKDLKTGEVTEETRKNNLQKFGDSLSLVTDLNNWHGFLNLFSEAGYVSGDLVASTNAVAYSYVLYLIGKYEYKVSSLELRKIIRKWIYMATVTQFYTGSTESEVEKQMADLRDIHSANEFVAYLEGIIDSTFTEDYFNYTLLASLNTSAANSPAWYAYLAAINVLGTPMLFSTMPASKYMIWGASGKKNSIDKHHIFPKHYLEQIGFTNDRDRNQIANFTYLDYQTNIDIADKPPAEYVTEYRDRIGEESYAKTCQQNALPIDFEKMDYQRFIEERRRLMAQMIKTGYEKLCE